MKRLISVFAFILVATAINAQTARDIKVEIGAGYSPFYFTYVDDGYNKQFDVAAYAEGRYYLTDHFAVGAKVDFKTGPSVTKNDGYLPYLDVLALAEYNLLPSKAVNPFISLGAGPAVGFKPYNTPVLLSISPRVGLELFRHLRLSATATFPTNFVGVDSTYFDACFCVGFVF
ncbi:MAG: outer membrane beta-barrel protein [Bacteroidales bacterium]|nr:outer membrane beta-barrel protein [Bacteroidales bacterium]